MKSLRELIAEAEEKKVAIGHFNMSDTEQMWGIFNAARELDVPAHPFPLLYKFLIIVHSYIGVTQDLNTFRRNARGERIRPILHGVEPL